jgi:hypothetical protein
MPRLGLPPLRGVMGSPVPPKGGKRNDVPPVGGLCGFVSQVAVERGATDT